MTIKASNYFKFNGIDSSDFNVRIITVDGGLSKEPFLANKKVKQITVNGKKKPFLQGTEYEVLSFNITIGFMDDFTRENRRAVAKWLNQDYPCELIFDGEPDRVFYAMVQGTSELSSEGTWGYVDLTFWTDSPYSYSRNYINNYDLTDNTEDGMSITIINNGDVNIIPDIEFQSIGNSSIAIVNTTNGNQRFEISNLVDGEKVYASNEDSVQQIISTQENLGIYRWDNFNKTFLEIVDGVNILKVYGTGILTIRHQFIFLQ